MSAEIATQVREPAAARRRPSYANAALVIFLAVEIIFFASQSRFFLTWDNLLNILTAVSVLGILAVPGTMLLISGELDLSVASATALVGVVMAVCVTKLGMPIPAAIAVSLLAGLLMGMINAFFVAVVGISSLITTLGTLAVFRGFTQILSEGTTITLRKFEWLGTGRIIFDIPIPVVIFVVLVLLGAFIMRYTVYGRSLYARGSSPAAARLVGIRGQRLVFTTFVLSGLATGVTGLVLVSQLGAASPNAATGLELAVVTAIILGGVSLSGGRGTITGTVLGILIIGVLNNGLVLLNVASFWQTVARGALLIAAASVDQLRTRVINR